jgi:hypothetical protein
MIEVNWHTNVYTTYNKPEHDFNRNDFEKLILVHRQICIPILARAMNRTKNNLCIILESSWKCANGLLFIVLIYLT